MEILAVIVGFIFFQIDDHIDTGLQNRLVKIRTIVIWKIAEEVLLKLINQI